MLMGPGGAEGWGCSQCSPPSPAPQTPRLGPRKRSDVDEAGRGRSFELFPMAARIRRAPDATVRAGEEQVGVLRRLCERVDAVALQLLRLAPSTTAIVAAAPRRRR